jgi:hypothetical protein
MFYPVSAQFWAFYPLLPLVVNNSAFYGSKMFGWLVISLMESAKRAFSKAREHY